MPVNSARSCGGRRPSSTWPPVTPPRAPASVWDHRWRSRWHFAASLGGGWAVPDGARTSTTPSRWPDTAIRQPSPSSSPGPTVWRSSTGCFGPMTPRCARSRRRCRSPMGSSNDIALGLAEYTLGVALLSRDDRGRPSPRAGADGAGPRPVAARACSLPGPGRRFVDRPGRGPGGATTMLPYR